MKKINENMAVQDTNAGAPSLQWVSVLLTVVDIW